MTWLLRLSYTDLLTASIKLLISLLAKPSSPTPYPLPFYQQSNNNLDNLCRKVEQNDLMIFTWIVLIALLNSHSQCSVEKNVSSHLNNNWLNHSGCLCRVERYRKSSTKVECCGGQRQYVLVRTWKCLYNISTECLSNSVTDTFKCHNSYDLFSSVSLSHQNCTIAH